MPPAHCKLLALAIALSAIATALPFLWGVQSGHLLPLATYQTTVCLSCVYLTRTIVAGRAQSLLSRTLTPPLLARALNRVGALYTDNLEVQAALLALQEHFGLQPLCQRLAAQDRDLARQDRE